MSNKTFASIIVSTYGRKRFFQDTVASLRSQVCHHGFEIIVVDNASSKREQKDGDPLVGQLGPQVRYIFEPRCGLHHARHAGAKAAKSEILIYVDDDVLAQPGWLEGILATYKDPIVGCVGGKCLPCWEVEPPAWAGAVSPGYYSLLDYGDEIRSLYQNEQLNGCNFAIRRRILFEVGGFNPDGFGDRRLVWYRGDGENGLLRKVRAAGYSVVYTPDAVIKHRIPRERQSLDYLRRRAFDAGIESGYIYYRYNQPPLGILLLKCTKLAARIAYRKFQEIHMRIQGQHEKEIAELVALSNTLGRFLYTIRLIFQPALRRHCIRRTYLD